MAEDDNNDAMAGDDNNDDNSSSASSGVSDDRPWIEEFEELCSSEDLTIEKLRRMPDIDLSAVSDDLYNSSFLHRVCMNEKVTLEMVKYLLDLYPQAINHRMDITNDYPEVESAYPLHLACYNKECPDEVITLLIEEGDEYILASMCYMNSNWTRSDIWVEDDKGAGGTPLHYYLSRTSNIKVAIISKMVNRWPYALVSTDEKTKCTPLHIFLHNKLAKMFGVVQYLVGTDPDPLQMKDGHGETPLHVGCANGYSTFRTIKMLLSVWGDALYERNVCGLLPIHRLCEKSGKQTDDELAKDILKLFIDNYPDSVTQTDDDSEDAELPLHIAANNKSKAFCKLLVDAYPESVKRPNNYGSLPFHSACDDGQLETVEYLFGLYPESLHIRDVRGYLPIHLVASNPGENSADIIKFLLLHDPECISKPVVSDDEGNEYMQGNSALPLHVACSSRDESNVIELLFDVYPEAILKRNGRGQLPIDIVREKYDDLGVYPETGELYNIELCQRLQYLIHFLSSQMNYARRAQDENAMSMPDGNGSLPLHKAIRDNEPLGTIKLLIKGNPDAIRVPDGSGRLPLDIACQFSTLGVVKYLAELSPDRLNTCHVNKNFLLHHACRGGNDEVISYLLETPMSSASVSERNVDGMQPIHLFCEFVKGRCSCEEHTEYTETIWRLLTAYPETVLNW